MTSTNDLVDLLEDCSSDENERAAREQLLEIDTDEAQDEAEQLEEEDSSDSDSSSSSISDTSSARSLLVGGSGEKFTRSMEKGKGKGRDLNGEGLLFREVSHDDGDSADSSVNEGMSGGRGGEDEATISELFSEDAPSSPKVRLARPRKRPHNLISDETSASSDSTSGGSDSEADQRWWDKFNGLPPAAKEAVEKFLLNPLREDPTPEEFETILQRLHQTESYLADESNYESVLEREGGFVELIAKCVNRGGTGYEKGQLHSIFANRSSNCIITRQRPGTATSHLAFLVRIINLAAGGFFFITSACGRKAFWTSFFPMIMPFFQGGGRALLAIPAGELSVEALEEQRSWQQVIEKETSGQLRFLFVTDYDDFQSWHIKEGLVVAPGGEMLDVEMSGNFNSRGLATEKALAHDEAAAALKPGSAERMTVRKIHFDEEEGQQFVRDLGDYWFDLAQDSSLFYNAPSLLDFLDCRYKKNLDALRRLKRSRLLRQVLCELEYEDCTEQTRSLQQTITLAGCVPSSERRERRVDPLTAPMELSDDSRKVISDLIKQKKTAYSKLIAQHKQELTEEEKVLVSNMNKEVLKDLIDFGGEDFVKALESIQEKKKSLKQERALSLAAKKSRPPKETTPKRSLPKKQKPSKERERDEDADADDEAEPQRKPQTRLRGKAAVKIAPAQVTITRCPVASCEFDSKDLHRHAHLEHFETLNRPIWSSLKLEIGEVFMDFAFCPIRGCQKKFKGGARGTNLCRHVATEHVDQIPEDPANDARFSRFASLLVTAMKNAQDCLFCSTRLPTGRDLGHHLVAKHEDELTNYATDARFSLVKHEIKKFFEKRTPCLHGSCDMKFFERSALVEHLTRGDHAKNIPPNFAKLDGWKELAEAITKRMAERPAQMQRHRPSGLEKKDRATKVKPQLGSLAKKPKL